MNTEQITYYIKQSGSVRHTPLYDFPSIFRHNLPTHFLLLLQEDLRSFKSLVSCSCVPVICNKEYIRTRHSHKQEIFKSTMHHCTGNTPGPTLQQPIEHYCTQKCSEHKLLYTPKFLQGQTLAGLGFSHFYIRRLPCFSIAQGPNQNFQEGFQSMKTVNIKTKQK